MITKDSIVRSSYEIRDSDAKAFFALGSPFSDLEKKAVDELCFDLKYYGIFTKYANIYPFVGLTGNNCKLDLKRQNNITWNNGIAGYFGKKGVKGDAFAFYGDTGKTANTLTQTNCGLMCYCVAPYLTNGLVAIGASNSGNSNMFEISIGSTIRSRISNNTAGQGILTNVPSPSYKGLLSTYRYSSSDHRIYINGTEAANNATNGGANPAFKIYTHARNINNAAQGWNPSIFGAMAIKGSGWSVQNHTDEQICWTKFVTTLNRVATATIADVNVLFDGDSISTTFYSSWTNIYVPDSFATRFFANPNVAVAGQNTTDILTDQVTQLVANYQSGKINIYNILIGTNDICSLATTPSSIMANIQTIIDNAHNAGYYVSIGTILPRSVITCSAVAAGTFESKRQALNELIRPSNAEMIFDIGNDPVIGQFGDSDNLTYYQDQTHPTQAGGKIIAKHDIAAITGFLYR